MVVPAGVAPAVGIKGLVIGSVLSPPEIEVALAGEHSRMAGQSSGPDTVEEICPLSYCLKNTDWIAYDAEIMKAMGLSTLEKVVGIVYFGTPATPLEDRPRPDPEVLVTRWRG